MSEKDSNGTKVPTSEPESKKRKLETTSPEPSKKPTSASPTSTSESEEKSNDIPPEALITLEDITLKDIPSISMNANRYIKIILSSWELTNKDPKLLLETKKSLFPLLVQLRKHTLDESQLTSLLTILYHLQRSEYTKAEESYMKLSIGNVAWPIGVVSVSIHARSRDSKLFGGKANIMIDEKTRRWITAIKRLITYEQQQQKK